MAYKPTDTFIPSNANGYFSDDSSGAAKSYKFSITKPTTYPGEETTNGFIWLLDLEALSKNNLNRAQQLAGRDFKSEVLFNTKPLFYTTKGNYYIFTSIFSFPEKNPKNGSELHDPFNKVQVRDGVRLIRLDLGTSLDGELQLVYGELKPSHTVDNIIDVALDYIKNIYIDIVYGRTNSTKWLEAIKENSGLSTEEISKVYDDIGKLGENKVSFFIDNNEPENIPENIQETDTNKSENLKNIIFNVQKEGIFSNSKFGELKLIGESGVDTEVGFNFGNEDDLSDLLLDDEFRESQFEGDEESFNEIIDEPPGPNPDEDSPVTTIPINLDPNSKLLSKVRSNYYIIDSSNGLAGKRLRNIMSGLESYLSKQYPGTKIGFNGVMRDLVASTYPNNPARAVASLHGAGLAIDVKFTIPGKKWDGIGDNKNLANDKKLSKLIYDYVKSQGDITWGGEWGTKDGTKAKSGIIKGSGITEYHHFEIKASKILDYWKPFKDEITELGINFDKLNKVGRGSELERLNKILLSSVDIRA
jgi:hypothetical protein